MTSRGWSECVETTRLRAALLAGRAPGPVTLRDSRAIGDAVKEEEQPEEVVPDAHPDAAAEPDVEFGAKDEEAQTDEWEEDAREGGV